MTTNRQALREAINDVILEPEPGYKRDALEAVGALARLYPIQFTDELAVLGPLLQLQLRDAAAYDNVRHFIDARRAQSGLPPCWPEPRKEKFEDRKTEYQRVLMQIRRDRPRRAAELEDLQRSDSDRLRGDPRVVFMKTAHHKWAHQLAERLEKARQAEGGRLPKQLQNTIREQFWHEVDTELDEREALIRAELLKPSHLRRKI